MQTLRLPSVVKPATMTRAEAADYLQVSKRTIDRMIADGTLRARKARHSVRILRSSVEIKETLP
jgi:excisionase family DNA binding protein